MERNNHGHAVLQALRGSGSVLQGPDHEPGWLTTGASKAQAFAHAVGALRDRALVIHDEITYWQLASIDGGTMRAPQGQHDDRAMACILALAAIEFAGGYRYVPTVVIPPGLGLRAQSGTAGRERLGRRCESGRLRPGFLTLSRLPLPLPHGLPLRLAHLAIAVPPHPRPAQTP